VEPTLRSDRSRSLLAVGLLLAITVAVYLPSIDGEFVLDDDTQIRDPLVTRPLSNSAHAWLTTWRPVTSATFALNYALGGLQTRGWHLTNVLIHLAATVLAWKLARRLLRRAGLERPEGAALVVAAIFALHPLQTEAVSYLVQRGESLASAFYLGAILVLLVRDEAATARRRGWLLALAVALHGLGLLTKPIAATLPVAWLLLGTVLPSDADEAIPAWRRLSRRVPETLPLFALSLASMIWTVRATAGFNHTGFDIPDVSVAQYLATQMRVIPTYLRLLLWPTGQCADWHFPFSPSLLDPPALLGAALLLGLATGSFWLALRSDRLDGDARAAARLAGFGFPFFLVALAPSSSIVPLHDALAEHRVYLPALGVALTVVGAATALLRRLGAERAFLAGSVVALTATLGLGVATARRNVVWSSLLALYQDATLSAPEKSRVQANLGLGLAMAGRHAEAITHFRRAIDQASDRTTEPGKNLRNLLSSLMALGLTDMALEETDRFLARRPDDARALAFRGYIRFARGDRAGGLAELSRSVALLPDDPQSLVLLANVEYVAGRDAEAATAARAALNLDPDNGMALQFLGLASLRRGDLPTAQQALRAAAAGGRASPSLLLQLGSVEERLGSRAEACRVYSAVVSAPDALSAGLARDLATRLGCR
jgi:tetratricopeptide (TPR) repeat protein